METSSENNSTVPQKGAWNIDSLALFAFSQSDASGEDPQVVNFAPQISIRSWQKWGNSGDESSDYNRSYIEKCHAAGILFIGGGTVSIIMENEASDSVVKDWASRDADNELLPILFGTENGYRGSLANPSFRNQIISFCSKQIDLGVDGLFLDEANGNYSGGEKHKYNGNEGFDDYTIAEFTRWLLNKYPLFTKEQWSSQFGMEENNYPRSDIDASDLVRNFNYRTYLKTHGWNSDPLSDQNPLSKLWGRSEGNRPNPFAGNFMEESLNRYWKEIIGALRTYARQKYSREIIITANGIFPDVDFNSVGLYNYNLDDNGAEASYVPANNGRFDGTVSLGSVYRQLRERAERISGSGVPTVLFLDWPCEMMNNYYGFTAQEKMDFWKIQAAEAYSNGLFYAFHLKTVMWGEPTTTASGIFDELKSYAQFYRTNGFLYRNATRNAIVATVSTLQISSTVTTIQPSGATVVHLINHNYDQKIIPQKSVSVSIPMNRTVTGAVCYSPDFDSSKKLQLTQNKGTASFVIDTLKSYSAIVLR